MIMEPKYFAFWRWLDTPIILWRSVIGSLGMYNLHSMKLSAVGNPLLDDLKVQIKFRVKLDPKLSYIIKDHTYQIYSCTYHWYMCTDRLYIWIAVHIYIDHVSLRHREHRQLYTPQRFNGFLFRWFWGWTDPSSIPGDKKVAWNSGRRQRSPSNLHEIGKSSLQRMFGRIYTYIDIYYKQLAGGFKRFLFSPLFGEDSHFD